jgi:hypothetical protein
METQILATLKECLGITGTDKDTQLTWSIKKSLATIKNLIGCDDIFLQDTGVDIVRKDKVKLCELYTECHPIYRMCLPVKAVQKIAGEIVDVCIKGHFIGIIQKSCGCSACSCVEIEWT